MKALSENIATVASILVLVLLHVGMLIWATGAALHGDFTVAGFAGGLFAVSLFIGSRVLSRDSDII